MIVNSEFPIQQDTCINVNVNPKQSPRRLMTEQSSIRTKTPISSGKQVLAQKVTDQNSALTLGGVNSFVSN